MPWPFRRAHTGRSATAESPAEAAALAGPSTALAGPAAALAGPATARPRDAWRGLAPLAGVVTAALANPSADRTIGFVSTLPSRWRQPPAVAPLAHQVRADVMGGVVGGLVSSVSQNTAVAGAEPQSELRFLTPMAPRAATRGANGPDTDPGEHTATGLFTPPPLIGPAAPAASRPTTETAGVSLAPTSVAGTGAAPSGQLRAEWAATSDHSTQNRPLVERGGPVISRPPVNLTDVASTPPADTVQAPGTMQAEADSTARAPGTVQAATAHTAPIHNAARAPGTAQPYDTAPIHNAARAEADDLARAHDADDAAGRPAVPIPDWVRRSAADGGNVLGPPVLGPPP